MDEGGSDSRGSPVVGGCPPPLWDHQRRAIEFGLRLPGFGLFAGMATGKSRVVVDLAIRRDVRRVFIACPLAVIPSWVDQFARYAPGAFHVVPLRGTVKERAETVRQTRSDKPTVFVTNYEATWREPFQSVMRKWAPEMVVADEAHALKTPSSKTSKTFAWYERHAKWRVGVTGTPTAERPLDLYALYRFLDVRCFGTQLDAFKAEYVIEQPTPYGLVVTGYKNLDQMTARMGRISFRVESDVLDLPPVVEVVRDVTMDPESWRVYKEMRKEMIADLSSLGEMPVVAPTILSRRLRLQQITSGFVDNTDKKRVRLNHAKRDALINVLEEVGAGERVTVFAVFTEDLDSIKAAAELAGRRYGELSGRANDLDGHLYPESCDVLGVQIKNGAAGIDLSRSSVAVYWNHMSLSLYEQSVFRLRRPDQKAESIRLIHLAVPGSIDATAIAALRKKREINQEVWTQFQLHGEDGL